MSATLVLEGLSKSFPGRPVFNNINASIESENTLVVTGPNGSGKSTLLRIICGFMRPTRGSAVLAVGDNDFAGIEARPFIGLVSPDLVLYDELTALENLSFFGKVAGLSVGISEFERRLAEVGLRQRGQDKVGSYSSGMKQRLKYCLALLRDPELLLLDEPTSNLDDAGRELVTNIIKSFNGILVIATNEKSETGHGDQIIRLGN
jgi:heme exporter protein A